MDPWRGGDMNPEEGGDMSQHPCISIFQAFYPNILWQAASGKYQIQVEKAQTQLDKTQSDFDRMQEKFERSQNEIRKVSHVGFQCIF